MTLTVANSFKLGFVTVTPAAVVALAENGLTAQDVLDRHAMGDWGDIGKLAKQRNETAISLKIGLRLHSGYKLPKTKHYFLSETGVWIITETATYSLKGINRINTIILMPDDYFEYQSPLI
jgi:hypothetical protein